MLLLLLEVNVMVGWVGDITEGDEGAGAEGDPQRPAGAEGDPQPVAAAGDPLRVAFGSFAGAEGAGGEGDPQRVAPSGVLIVACEQIIFTCVACIASG